MTHVRRTSRPVGTALLVAPLLAACALAGSTVPASVTGRPPQDAPPRFVTDDLPPTATASDTLPGPGCRSPLIDPRDGTRLRMVNAQGRVGDYEVPAGRYGVRAGERLRIECNTGRPVGIVPAGS